MLIFHLNWYYDEHFTNPVGATSTAISSPGNKIYFNYGGQGPMPQTAMDAITTAQEYIQRSGPFSTEVNA